MRRALVLPICLLVLAPWAGPALGSGGLGMTWAKSLHSVPYGADNVGCLGCNPYVGDTPCSTSLPILCIKTDGAPNPGLPLDFYHGWIGGNLGLTPAYAGTALGSLSNANALCASFFGPGWVMAEFHHPGGGWNWSSHGHIADGTRFWVTIDDQTAECWDP